MNKPAETALESLSETIRELCDLPRVTVLSEDDDVFEVEYGGETISVVKSDETCFIAEGGGAASGSGADLSMSLRQNVAINTGIFQDELAREFMEVMIFHELREREYKEAGLEDAHQRAVHDEILYIMAHLPHKQAEYFAFAKEYRESRAAKPEDDNEAAKPWARQFETHVNFREDGVDRLPKEIERQAREMEESAELRRKAMQVVLEKEEEEKKALKRMKEFLALNPDFFDSKSKQNIVMLPASPLSVMIEADHYTLSTTAPGLRAETCTEICTLLGKAESEGGMAEAWSNFSDSGLLALPTGTDPEIVRQVHDLLLKDIRECKKLTEKMKGLGFIVARTDQEGQYNPYFQVIGGKTNQYLNFSFEEVDGNYGTFLIVYKGDLPNKMRKTVEELGWQDGAISVKCEKDGDDEFNAILKFNLDNPDGALRSFEGLKQAVESMQSKVKRSKRKE
jgi:hypothetical protein